MQFEKQGQAPSEIRFASYADFGDHHPDKLLRLKDRHCLGNHAMFQLAEFKKEGTEPERDNCDDGQKSMSMSLYNKPSDM